MNTASLLALLQLTATILTSHAPTQATVNLASNIVQLVTQASAPINFAVPRNDSMWPDMKDLLYAPYISAPGQWSNLNSSVRILPEYTSFGDLNRDGSDDAAVIVNRPTTDGTPNYFLAAMLNQGGIMFNIADFPLGKNLNFASHTITAGVAQLNNDSYWLLGNTLLRK